jgi:hypothetical protein
MTTLSIPIRAKTETRLERYIKRTHAGKVKVVQTALDRFLAIQEFEEMQKLVEPRARKQGFKTDEDVFKVV